MCLKIRIGLTVIGIILIILSLIFSLYLFPLSTRKQIINTVKLENGTDGYARWETLPIPIQYKIYFFNVTNPEEVQQGAKPVVKEVGPYVYNQQRWKTNITEDEDRLSYYQNLGFKFDSFASNGLLEADIITIANLPLMSLITIAERSTLPLLSHLEEAIAHIFGSPKDLFLRATPKEFLFDGIFLACDTDDTLIDLTCRIIELLAPPTLRRLDDGRFKFSLLSHKNESGDGELVVNSGTNDIDKLGEILNWQGSSTLNTWKENSTCNEIVGSDSTIYPPGINPKSLIRVFSVDICRSVTLEYSSDTEYSNIFGHRYVADKKMLSSPSSYPSNECYCLNVTSHHSNGCLLDGAMELWSCQEAPIVFSFPHFYLADETYQTGVEGLEAKASSHEMYVDLEPNTGTPLRGHKRVQFNIFYRPIENITMTENLTTTLVPVVWLDEGVELSDDLINELNEQLFDVLQTLDLIHWSMLGIGVTLVAVNVLWWFISCCRE